MMLPVHMRRLMFGHTTTHYLGAQIREAVEVLDKLNPLQHVATVRKSQVQHALAEMLTLMLAHSVAVDEPRWVADSQHQQRQLLSTQPT
jgi:hypothetical protein